MKIMPDPTPDVRHPIGGHDEKGLQNLQTPGDGTDGRSGWCGRGAHQRCVGIYDVVCCCTCHDGTDPQELLAVHAAQLEQPAWAGRRYYAPDRGRDGAVVYLWDAPVQEGLRSSPEFGHELDVSLQLHRLMTLADDGSVVVEDEQLSVHCDAGDLWLTPADARAFAAALVACADRLDAAS